MTHNINDIVVGEITKVRPFALFIKLEDGTEGLIHISELSDSYVKDIEAFGTVGDKLTLRIIQIDEKNGFLRLSYKSVPDDQKALNPNGNKKHAISSEDSEFAPLKEKLPEWINEVLKKMEERK